LTAIRASRCCKKRLICAGSNHAHSRPPLRRPPLLCENHPLAAGQIPRRQSCRHGTCRPNPRYAVLFVVAAGSSCGGSGFHGLPLAKNLHPHIATGQTSSPGHGDSIPDGGRYSGVSSKSVCMSPSQSTISGLLSGR